jgi:hypothetical protein
MTELSQISEKDLNQAYLVTKETLSARVQDANNKCYDFNKYFANFAHISGGFGEVFSPEQGEDPFVYIGPKRNNPESRDQFNPSEGMIIIKGNEIEGDGVFSENALSDSIESRLESMRASLAESKIPVLANVSDTLYGKRNIIITSNENDMSDIAEAWQAEKIYGEDIPSMEDVVSHISPKQGFIVMVENYQTSSESDASTPRFDDSDVKVSLAIFYSKDNPLLEQLEQAKGALRALGTLQLIPSPTNDDFRLEFDGPPPQAKPDVVNMSFEQYQNAIIRMKEKAKESIDSDNPFLQFLREDVEKAADHPLSYHDAVTLTRSVFPSLLQRGELISQIGICNTVTTLEDNPQDGILVIFNQPLNETLSYVSMWPEFSHREIHRINEIGRSYPPERKQELSQIKGRLAYINRGYLFLTTGGIKFGGDQFSIPNDKKTTEFLSRFGETEILTSESQKAEVKQYAYLVQMETALKNDLVLLKESNIPSNDIRFYENWFRKFRINKEYPLEVLQSWDVGGVTVYEKLLDLEEIVRKQKKLHKQEFIESD